MKVIKKNPKVDLKLRYKRVLNVGMVISLMIMIFSFYSFQDFENGVALPEVPDLTTDVIIIPQTKWNKKPLRPSIPHIPVESDDEDVEEDATIDIDDNVINLDDVPPPPPSEIDEIVEIFNLSKKPVLIYKEVPGYPTIAKKAGIQGNVVITVTIGKDGLVEDADVLKSIPMLDDAALKAAMKCKFTPAKQMDKPVRVRMSIPFNFLLK